MMNKPMNPDALREDWAEPSDEEMFAIYASMKLLPGELVDPELAKRYEAYLEAQPIPSTPALGAILKGDVAGHEFHGNQWKQVSGKKGSNPGGVYEKGGIKHYVKFPNSKGQIHAEATADKIYEMMGVKTMNHTPTDVNGKLGSVSVWKAVTPLGKEGWTKLTSEQVDQAAKAFVASALTKNWDVVGLTHDNIGKDIAGNLAILDTGGSFHYRAQGEPKPYGGDATPEIKGMLDPSKTSGRVFAPLLKRYPAAFQRAADALKAIPDYALTEVVAGHKAGTQDDILARKASIIKYFDNLKE